MGLGDANRVGATNDLTFRIDADLNIKKMPSMSVESSDKEVMNFIDGSISPHLSQQQTAVIKSDRVIIDRFRELLAVIYSISDSYEIQIDVHGEGIPFSMHIEVSRILQIDGKKYDLNVKSEIRYSVAELEVRAGHEKKKPPIKKHHKKPPVRIAEKPIDDGEKIALPDANAKCARGDLNCQLKEWVNESTKDMLSCRSYFVEQEKYENKFGRGYFYDPNLPEGSGPTPESSMRNIPSGSKGSDIFKGIYFQTPPALSRPSPKCVKEYKNWNRQVPTLECAKQIEQCAMSPTCSDDPAVVVIREFLTSIGPLRLLKAIWAVDDYKARRSAGYKAAWANLWIDKFAEKLKEDDKRYVEAAIRRIEQNYGERYLLREMIANWKGGTPIAERDEIIKILYDKYFTSLYPEKLDRYGFPDINKMPTKLMWATNLLSMVSRKNVSLGEVLSMLRCLPDWGKMQAVLKNLLPYFRRTKDYQLAANTMEILFKIPKGYHDPDAEKKISEMQREAKEAIPLSADIKGAVSIVMGRENASPEARIYAIRWLSELEYVSEKVKAVLQKIKDEEPNEEVRQATIEALQK